MSHTPGPWKLGEFEEHCGYNCMSSAVSAGHAVFDGKHYGQASCQDIEPEAKARMIADARLTSAAPDLLEALETIMKYPIIPNTIGYEMVDTARAAIAKARGQ